MYQATKFPPDQLCEIFVLARLEMLTVLPPEHDIVRYSDPDASAGVNVVSKRSVALPKTAANRARRRDLTTIVTSLRFCAASRGTRVALYASRHGHWGDFRPVREEYF